MYIEIIGGADILTEVQFVFGEKTKDWSMWHGHNMSWVLTKHTPGSALFFKAQK